MEEMVDNGWNEIIRRNRKLAIKGRRILCDELGIKVPFPDEMVTAIASIELPDKEIPPFSIQGDPLHNKLLDEYAIQVPIFPWEAHNTRYIRISSQLYNHIDEYEYLAKALNECV
jgi:isopenicillin-N epimerase